jgi:adenylate cyclase
MTPSTPAPAKTFASSIGARVPALHRDTGVALRRRTAPLAPVQVTALSAAERAELRRGLAVPGKIEKRAAELLSRFLLVEVVNHALNSLSLDELLKRLVALAASSVEAERGTIFLFDGERNELFSRVMQGSELGEIRIPSSSGIAGATYNSGQAEIVDDAYADPRFNPEVDQHTGYRTRSLMCVPLQRQDGTLIGVFEILNKRQKSFDAADLALVNAIGAQAAAALEHARTFEDEMRERRRDQHLLEIAEAVSIELDLGRLLERIVEGSAALLDGERATLFMHDPATGELWSRVTAGGRVAEMRIPDDSGIAGVTFRTGTTINLPDARADPRFNPDMDAQTGFTTLSLISVPVLDTAGIPTAVLQVLNSRFGRFTGEDERRLCSFASQAAVAIHNAQLFTDILALKSYTEGLLRSLPDPVITLDGALNVVNVNQAGQRLLGLTNENSPAESAERLWGAANAWFAESLAYVAETGRSDHRQDVEFVVKGEVRANVNATLAPLRDGAGALTGVAIILQDIGRQKKTHATISRYMAKEFAERVLSVDGAAPQVVCATMLFSDIRRFTTIAETLTPQGTVDMLNEYFSEMADSVQQHNGVLDKYIGDAVMAVFGAVVASPADADNAAAAAIEMMNRLRALNQRRSSRGAQPLEIGIGLASGEIVAGPVGSPDRVNYTVIGDSVNLASRLEGANKQYGTSVLLSAATAERLIAPARLRRVDLLRVKGKDTPTEVFELLDHHSPETRALFEKVLNTYEDGVRLYRARRWSRALDRFAAVIEVMPNDGPSWVYTDRCLYYREHSPPDHWDGVWAMKTK